MEEKASSLFLIKSWLIHAAAWRFSFAVSSRNLIGRETINIPSIFSGVHGFKGKTVNETNQCIWTIYLPQLSTVYWFDIKPGWTRCVKEQTLCYKPTFGRHLAYIVIDFSFNSRLPSCKLITRAPSNFQGSRQAFRVLSPRFAARLKDNRNKSKPGCCLAQHLIFRVLGCHS